MRFSPTLVSATMAILLWSAVVPAGFCAEAVKIGTVNFQRIFENSTGGKAAKDRVNSEGQRMEQELKQHGEEIKALEKRLDQDAGVMNKQAREDQKWELERKVEDVKVLRKKYERKIQELQVQQVNDVRQSVLQIVQDYGKKEGFTLIIEDMGVVYAPKNLDVTDEIVKLYNEQYAKQGKPQQGPKR